MPLIHEIFMYRVHMQGDCVLWNEPLTKEGYGRFRYKGKMTLAHRLSWELFHNCSAEGLHILHTCDTPACINPEHLFDGTNQDNVDDKVMKGRQSHKSVNTGQTQHLSILTEKDVLEILRKYALGLYTHRMLAEDYKVSQTTISDILNNKTWKHLCRSLGSSQD